MYKRQVCVWNYELILDADAHRNDPKDFKDYSEYQDKDDSLKADEKRLDLSLIHIWSNRCCI